MVIVMGSLAASAWPGLYTERNRQGKAAYPGVSQLFWGAMPSRSVRRWRGLAKADQTGDVSSMPLEPATRFTVHHALDAMHVRKPKVSR